MDQINEQEKKLHDMAIQAMKLYNDKEFEKTFFMERQNTNSKRAFFKHCVESVTQQDFEHSLSHQVNLTIQKIRREQAILKEEMISSSLDDEEEGCYKSEDERKYYESLGGGNAKIGKELFEKTILGRSDDDKDDA